MSGGGLGLELRRISRSRLCHVVLLFVAAVLSQVASSGTFSAVEFPLASPTVCTQSVIYPLRSTTTAVVYARPRTVKLSAASSAQQVSDALEQLPTIGKVTVVKTSSTSPVTWTIQYDTQVSSSHPLLVNSEKVTSGGVSIATTYVGRVADGYRFVPFWGVMEACAVSTGAGAHAYPVFPCSCFWFCHFLTLHHICFILPTTASGKSLCQATSCPTTSPASPVA